MASTLIDDQGTGSGGKGRLSPLKIVVGLFAAGLMLIGLIVVSLVVLAIVAFLGLNVILARVDRENPYARHGYTDVGISSITMQDPARGIDNITCWSQPSVQVSVTVKRFGIYYPGLTDVQLYLTGHAFNQSGIQTATFVKTVDDAELAGDGAGATIAFPVELPAEFRGREITWRASTSYRYDKDPENDLLERSFRPC